MIDRAPLISEVIETSNGYVKAAVIGLQLAYYIRSLGYRARVHLAANYLSVLPLVAREAGLGEIGRNTILTTKEYGSRVRLGLVTTEMELIADQRISFGLERFCELCGLCADNCPARAISSGERVMIDDELRWQIVQEDCYRTWRSIGTDCGICISSCPFSQGMVEPPVDDREISHLIEQYRARFGKRPFIKDPPIWLGKDRSD